MIRDTRIGDYIRQLREAKRWSQQELAKQMGRNVSWVGQLERGVIPITLNSLDKFAAVFRIPVERFLFAGSDNQGEFK